MSKLKEFLARKDIVISPQRYLIDALGAMAQGLFASLLIGTIIKTVGQQTGLALLVDLGGYATAMSGPAMACAIGWALHCPPLVLFSLITVGYSANALGGAGGPLAVLIIAIVAAELGKVVSKETKVDILVTPLVTIFAGVGLSMLIAAPIGAAASQVGTLIMWATEQAPLVMGILVSVIVGVALTLPISSAAICAAWVWSKTRSTRPNWIRPTCGAGSCSKNANTHRRSTSFMTTGIAIRPSHCSRWDKTGRRCASSKHFPRQPRVSIFERSPARGWAARPRDGDTSSKPAAAMSAWSIVRRSTPKSMNS